MSTNQMYSDPFSGYQSPYGGPSQGYPGSPSGPGDAWMQTTPPDPSAGHLFEAGSLPDSYLDFTWNEEDMQHDIHMDEELAEDLIDDGILEAYVIPEGRNNYRTYTPGSGRDDTYVESDEGELWFRPEAADSHIRLEDDNIARLMEEAGGDRVKLSGFPQKHVDTDENYAVVVEAYHDDLDEPIQLWDEVRVGDHRDLVMDQIYHPFAAEGDEPRTDMDFNDRWLRDGDYVSDNFANMVGAAIGPESSPFKSVAKTLDWFTGERHEYKDADEKISNWHALKGRKHKDPENHKDDYSMGADFLSDFLGVSLAHGVWGGFGGSENSAS